MLGTLPLSSGCQSAPLRGCELKWLLLGAVVSERVSAPLRGCELKWLLLGAVVSERVSAPLRGCELKWKEPDGKMADSGQPPCGKIFFT